MTLRARRHFAAIALVLSCFAVAAATSMTQKSPTWDEPLHLTAGYAYLITRDFRINLEHPPLIKMLAALPLLALHLDPPVGTSDGSADVSSARTQFVFRNAQPARIIIFWGRLPIVLVGTALAAFVYWWTRQLAGPAAGILALTLYAFDPNLLAHTQVVTMDVGLAGVVAVAMYALVRYLKASSARTLWGAGIAFALAMLIKFTAMLLVPIYALLVLVRHARRGPAAAWSSLWRLTLVMGVATVGLAFVAYGFQIGKGSPPWPLVALLEHTTGPSSIPVRAILKLSHVPRPAPAFWAGLQYQAESSSNHIAYLNGQRYHGGRLDYFPVAFLVKTPVATLALGGLAVAVFTYRIAAGTKTPPSFDEIAILVAIIAFFGFTVGLGVNVGLRYVLPVYPLLFIFIASQLAWLHSAAAGRKSFVTLVVVGLLTFGVVSSIRAYPDYLAYFNEPSGGPENGWKHLADSNLDWGQDLPGVQAYLARHGIHEVYFGYFGTAVPDAYGIHWNALPTNQEVATSGAPPGLVAVSVSALLLELPRDSWVWQYHPTATIGHSIWIFDLRPPGSAGSRRRGQ